MKLFIYWSGDDTFMIVAETQENADELAKDEMGDEGFLSCHSTEYDATKEGSYYLG